jgi:hypothetical protein
MPETHEEQIQICKKVFATKLRTHITSSRHFWFSKQNANGIEYTISKSDIVWLVFKAWNKFGES